jgi:hypothetical protein
MDKTFAEILTPITGAMSPLQKTVFSIVIFFTALSFQATVMFGAFSMIENNPIQLPFDMWFHTACNSLKVLLAAAIFMTFLGAGTASKASDK